MFELIDHQAIAIEAEVSLGDGRARHVANYALEFASIVCIASNGAIEREAVSGGGERFARRAVIGHRAGAAQRHGLAPGLRAHRDMIS